MFVILNIVDYCYYFISFIIPHFVEESAHMIVLNGRR